MASWLQSVGRLAGIFLIFLAATREVVGEGLRWEAGAGFRRAAVQPGAGGRVGFTWMDPQATGVHFTNQLAGDAFATNAVAHNGAGLAIGDVDGDGWPDIYLCNLQGPNQLLRNLGGWRFQPMEIGAAACADQMSMGAVLADVDGDGDLDLLVTGVQSGTRLFLNDGQGRWTESQAHQMSRNGSTTSLALADIDGDGDLDLYCTHYIDVMYLADPSTRFGLARRGDKWEVTKVNGESTRLPRWKDRFEALADGRVRELAEADGFYRNDGRGGFVPIQSEPGTFLDTEGKPIPPYRDWGLSVMFRDLNGDLAPDLYVCNDMPSPDRVWINQGKGTFRLMDAGPLRHTSRSAMGIDFADINRDGLDDFMVVDMLARDRRKRLTQLVRDLPDPVASEWVQESPSYNRNTLFLGRRDGTYAEVALMAGVAATDWSWCPVFLDVDLDGYEDLLVANGFAFDVMDQDSNDAIRSRKLTLDQQRRVRLFHPPWPTENLAYRNRRDGTFEAVGATWGFHQAGVSYGMALADLDNDGDLDVVVNNLNAVASVYRNDAAAGRVQVRLRGKPGNTAGIGAKIRLIGGSVEQSQEMICGGRYLSGDQAVRVFAADPEDKRPLRLEVQWRDGSVSRVEGVQGNHVYEVQQSGAVPPAPIAPKVDPPLFVLAQPQTDHVHVDEPFDDASRQAMVPHRLSRLGPGVAWSDLDGDGWEDLVIAAGTGGRLAVLRNEAGHGFRKLESTQVARADQGAVVGWPDGTGRRRLLVAASNLGLPPGTPSQLEVHDGLQLDSSVSLPLGPSSPGPVALADLDGDGDLDVFVGGGFLPGRYPEAASSGVWRNEAGTLVPDPDWGRPFAKLGLVRGATFTDLDGDGRPDLVLATEWGPVRLFRNTGRGFTEVTESWGMADATGWWTGVTTGDFDGDGRLDLAVGNWGRNSIHELHQPTAFRIYHGDWVGDGTLGVLEAVSSGGRWFPERDRTWLSRGMPTWAERFPTHKAFSEATVDEILGDALGKSSHLEARELRSHVFLNRGGRFEAHPLPWPAQVAPVFAVQAADLDGDGREDLFLGQNFFGTLSDLSRDDAGQGLWLAGAGDGSFRARDSVDSGIRVLGEQRGAALADYDHDGRVDLVVSQNQGATRIHRNQGAKPGLRVRLRGPVGNPDAVGAVVRLQFDGGRLGPARMILAGSGYWSQDGAIPVLGSPEPPVGVWVRWPGGREQSQSVSPGQREVVVDVK